MKSKKWVRRRHNFYSNFFRPQAYLIFKILYGMKVKKYHLKRHENVLIYGNHQTDIDPLGVQFMFNKNIYFVATDSLFSQNFAYHFLGHCFAPVPKKKGASDPKMIKTVMKIAKEGGSICIFPEGNRNYAEFQYYMDLSVAKLVKVLHIPLLLVNVNGGNGVLPRFAGKKRKGKFTYQVVRRVEVDEYMNMSDEKLLELIKDTIRVYDSDSGNLYKSDARAEYLERMLFVCPKCGKIETLHSNGNYLTCSHCGLKVEYTEDLHLKSDDKSFNFNRLIDWYEFQRKWVNDYIIPEDNSIIFKDDNVNLVITGIGKGRTPVDNGKITLTKDYLTVGNTSLPVKDIEIASPISGKKFNFTIGDKEYLIIGDDRFNPLKYVFMFHRLDCKVKDHDHYFRIDNKKTS